jgi:uncharacterized cupredoxin-like copper-binding protein
LLAGCSSRAEASEMTVTIKIHHSAFLPSNITVPEGTKVNFVIRNTDPIAHEFIVGDAAVQQRHEDGTEPHHGAKPGEVSIDALEVATTQYVFDEAGTLIFGCHLPQHYDYGMRGAIEVSER